MPSKKNLTSKTMEKNLTKKINRILEILKENWFRIVVKTKIDYRSVVDIPGNFLDKEDGKFRFNFTREFDRILLKDRTILFCVENIDGVITENGTFNNLTLCFIKDVDSYEIAVQMALWGRPQDFDLKEIVKIDGEYKIIDIPSMTKGVR